MLWTLFKGDKSNIMLKDNESAMATKNDPFAAFPSDLKGILDPGHVIDKNQIYFHRSYRKLQQQSLAYVAFSLLILVVFVDFLVMYYYSQITLGISQFTKMVLSTVIPEQLIEIVPKIYITDNVHVVALPGRYPSIKLSIIVAIISLTLFFSAIYLKRVIEPKMVWLIFITFINTASSIFFIFFAGYFPYDLEIFSEMYIKTEVGIWVIIPIVLTIALIPFPITLIKKLMVILLTLGYSIVFATVRYIVFLYLLRSTSYLFMALMFFMLGPFLDFIYIVGSYSLCLSSAGKYTRKKMELWNWLY
jgi:hypothetical protein